MFTLPADMKGESVADMGNSERAEEKLQSVRKIKNIRGITEGDLRD